MKSTLLLLLRQTGELLAMPWRAAFDRRAYVQVVTEGVGIGFGVLLLATFIGTAAIAINLYWLMHQTLAREVPHYLADLPTLTLSGGVVSLPEGTPVPLLIRHPEDQSPLMLVDPNATERPTEPAGLRAFLGLDTVHFLQGGHWLPIPLKVMPDGVYDRAALERFLGGLPRRQTTMVFPSIWMKMIIYQLSAIFILGSATWMLLRGQVRKEYEFAPVLRLAGLAMCPAFLIVTALGLLGLPEQTTLICYLFIFGGYLYFGVQSLQSHLRQRDFVAPPALLGSQPPASRGKGR